MLKIYLTSNGTLLTPDSLTKGAWINLVNPTEHELAHVAASTGIFSDFLRYPLDDEERPRLEIEDNQTLIILNVPTVFKEDGSTAYDTMPLGIIITEDYLVTVCLQDLDILRDFSQGKVRSMATFKKTRFVFQVMQKTAVLYLKYLRDINKKTDEIELELHKSMRNKELIRLLEFEKSLVYFSTSLRSNETVMEKILNAKTLKMYEEDHDLLEDVIVENKQAIEMADIYTNILSSMMDAFASIISNNLNIVMKFLASITIVVSLPTMVASFFGMNVDLPFQHSPSGFAIILCISLGLSLFSILYLKKRNIF